MDDSFRIETGRIVIEVNDAGETISFNPNDPNIALAFSSLIEDFDKKLEEFKEIEKQLEEIPEEETARSISASAKASLAICEWCETKIDSIFGVDASRKVFGGDHVPEAYGLFFEAITPYIKKGRNKVLEKYKKPAKK